jgi:hypothetical protein
VTQLYPQALGSLFVASYDSQGCGGLGERSTIHRKTYEQEHSMERGGYMATLQAGLQLENDMD